MKSLTVYRPLLEEDVAAKLSTEFDDVLLVLLSRVSCSPVSTKSFHMKYLPALTTYVMFHNFPATLINSDKFRRVGVPPARRLMVLSLRFSTREQNYHCVRVGSINPRPSILVSHSVILVGTIIGVTSSPPDPILRK